MKKKKEYRFSTTNLEELRRIYGKINISRAPHETNYYTYGMWKEITVRYIRRNISQENMQDFVFFLKKQMRGDTQNKDVLMSLIFPIYMLVLPFLIDAEVDKAIYQLLDEAAQDQIKVDLVIPIALYLLIWGAISYFSRDKKIGFYEDMLDIVESEFLSGN